MKMVRDKLWRAPADGILKATGIRPGQDLLVLGVIQGNGGNETGVRDHGEGKNRYGKHLGFRPGGMGGGNGEGKTENGGGSLARQAPAVASERRERAEGAGGGRDGGRKEEETKSTGLWATANKRAEARQIPATPEWSVCAWTAARAKSWEKRKPEARRASMVFAIVPKIFGTPATTN